MEINPYKSPETIDPDAELQAKVSPQFSYRRWTMMVVGGGVGTLIGSVIGTLISIRAGMGLSYVAWMILGACVGVTIARIAYQSEEAIRAANVTHPPPPTSDDAPRDQEH
jgi:hypothetical protein